jgi:predicted transcriptional regulator
MDRILSARIDDSIYRKINDLSLKMHTSKKAIIEMAVKLLGQRIEQEKQTDVFDETCGAWNRKESPSETISHIRTAFRSSMERYQE